MKNKYFIFFLFSVAFFGIITCALAIDNNPKVIIDGRKIDFNPPCQLVNDRIMVPLRFMLEDKSFDGQVYWNNDLRKVEFACLDRHIELYIGDKTVLVDGKKYYLDTAPYIYNDRAYISLRFLAERLGFNVDWNNGKKEVHISTGTIAEVFAYYYYTPISEYVQNIHLFSDVVYRWFMADGKGELYYEYSDNYKKVLEIADQNGVKKHASVFLIGEDGLHELLSSKENRLRLIGNLVKKVETDKYDGINIDFELIAPSDGGLFTTFLRELRNSLDPQKMLSVAVSARTGKENWPIAYQYDQIGKIADVVVVMAYDYSYSGSSPGPIAPLWWVNEVVIYMQDNIEREKILLGLPTYGYNWAKTGTTAITAEKLAHLRKQYQLDDHFDEKSQSPYYTYNDAEGVFHEIWFENEKSLKPKLDIVKDNNLRGISFWRIGTGCQGLYNLLSEEENKHRDF